MQEIDGQLESERKYVERLAIEDFGSTHVGKVVHDDDDDDDDDDDGNGGGNGGGGVAEWWW